MADETPADKDEKDKRQQKALELRRQVSAAHSAVTGDQTARDFSSFTFEEAIDQQIERIEPTEKNELRPGLLDQVNKVETDLVSAIEQIKALPPEQFRETEDDDVNKTLDANEQKEYDAWLSKTIADRETVQE